MSIGIQTSADFLLSNISVTNYCEPLMSYAQAYHKQVKELFPGPNPKDPIGHSLEPSDYHRRGKGVADIEVDCFHPRWWMKSSYFG